MWKIDNILCCINTGKSLIQYQKSYKWYLRQFCLHLVLLKMFRFLKKREKIQQTLFMIFHSSGLLLPQTLIHQWRINIQHSMFSHPVFMQQYNLLIQLSSRWKKYPTLNVIFLLQNNIFNSKEVTGHVVDNYVSIFIILQKVCFLKHRRKI